MQADQFRSQINGFSLYLLAQHARNIMGRVCGPAWSEHFDRQLKSPFLTHPSSMAEASIAFGVEGSGENDDGTGNVFIMSI